MYLSTKHIQISKTQSPCFEYFASELSKQLDENEIPIRFAIIGSQDQYYHVEVGFCCSSLAEVKSYQSIFKHQRELKHDTLFNYKIRCSEDHSSFNVVCIIPTGIGCQIGGHAGDAGSLVRALGEMCDTLVVNPNVVNASDINEMPDNALYVEGSIITRFLMGEIVRCL